MNLLIIGVFSLIYFSVCVFTQEFKGPLEDVLKEKLNLSGEEFMKKCQTKSRIVVDSLLRSRKQAKIVGNDLADDILNRVKMSPNPNEQTWNNIVRNRCTTNTVIKNLSHFSVDVVNLCLDDNEKLTGDKKDDFGNALTKGYCPAVKKLAKEKYKA